MAQLRRAECKPARGFQAGRWSVHARTSPAVTALLSPQSLIFFPVFSVPSCLFPSSFLSCLCSFIPSPSLCSAHSDILPASDKQEEKHPGEARRHTPGTFSGFSNWKTTKQGLSNKQHFQQTSPLFVLKSDQSHMDVTRLLIPSISSSAKRNSRQLLYLC